MFTYDHPSQNRSCDFWYQAAFLICTRRVWTLGKKARSSNMLHAWYLNAKIRLYIHVGWYTVAMVINDPY